MSRNELHLNDDYRDLLRALNDEGVEYLIVGAHAMAFHGYVRTTGDIDVFVKPDPTNAQKVLRSLREFGSPVEVSLEELSKPDLILQIGVSPCRIDLITSISGVSFDEAETELVKARAAGLVVPVINLANLKRNKKASGRPKDLADLAALEKL